MRTRFGAWRATYTAGDWLALSGPGCLVMMPPAPPSASGMLGEIWDDILTSANITDVATKLANWGMEQLPDLAVFFVDDQQVHCLLRGQVGVVDADSGDLLASGVGAKTWFETKLDSRRLYIAVQEVDAANLLQLPLVIGAAQVSSVFLDAMDVEVRFNVAPSVALPTLAEEAAALAAAEAEAVEAAADQAADVNQSQEVAASVVDAEPAADADQAASVAAASMWGDAGSEAGSAEVQPVVEGNEEASVAAASMWGDVESEAGSAEVQPIVEGNEEASVAAASMWGDTAAEPEAEEAAVGDQAAHFPEGEIPKVVMTSVPEPGPEPEIAQGSADGAAAQLPEIDMPEVVLTPSPEANFSTQQEPASAPELAVALEPEPAVEPATKPEVVADVPTDPAPTIDAARQSIAQPEVDDQHGEFPVQAEDPQAQQTSPQATWQTPGAPEPTQVLGDRPPYAEGQHPDQLAPVSGAFQQVHQQPSAPAPQGRRSGGWQGTIRPRPDVSAAPAAAPQAPAAAPQAPAPQPPIPQPNNQGDQLIAGVPESFRVAPAAPQPANDWRQERPRMRPADIADDHDGETVFATGLAQTHKPGEGSRADESLVLAAMCAYGHPNQPGAPRCRVCGSNVDSHNPQLTSAPVLAIVETSDGERYELTRPIIIGRSPSRGDRDGDVQLVKVMSPNQDVSRNHLRIAAKGWQIEISDLNSTNGTVVTRPGSEPIELSGAAMAAEIGTKIDLGDGQIVTLASPTGNQ